MTAPDWPRLMKRSTACAYVEMSAAEFEREIVAGRLPHPVQIGRGDRWSRTEIDSYINRLTGDVIASDWRSAAPLYGGKRANG